MLDRLTSFSLSQRLLILVIMIILVIAGVLSFNQLPVDAFPDVSSTQVQIVMKAPGMTPEEIENRIVYPIEQELLGIPHQRILRTQSKYAIAVLTVDFDDGTDPYWARQQVNERLSGVLDKLPSTAYGGIAPMTTPLGEMYMFTIEGNIPDSEKRYLLDRVIRPQLRSIPGVADVNSLGGHVATFEVQPRLKDLAARGVTIADLNTAIRANHRSDGAGRIDQNEETMLVRSDSRITNADQLKAILVKSVNQIPITVGDVADVVTGSLTRYGAVTQNGQQETVEGIILGLRGANARQLVQHVDEHIAEIQSTLPKGVKISPFYNRGDLVGKAIKTVEKALTESIVLVLILLVVFLGNLRAAFVVALILPLSALGTFILMRMFGVSANLMSLGGLAIAIGLLVDAAVVVVENIESTENQATILKHPAPRLHVIYRAVQEVAVPVSAGMGIIMVVFMPLLTLQGLEGKLFSPVAITIVFALAVSLLLSLTVIPVLASFILKPAAPHTPVVVAFLESVYKKCLNWSLNHSKTVYTVSLAALLVSVLVIFPFIGKSFMPTLDEGDAIMQIEKIPSVHLSSSTNLDLKIQQQILKHVPDVARIVARTGSDEIGLDPMGLNETDTFLVLKPKEQWQAANKDEILSQVRKTVNEIAGVNFSFTQPIEMRTSEMLSGVRGDLAVKIFGSDLNTLAKLSDQIAGILDQIKGSEDVIRPQNSGVQYLEVKIDRQAASRLGLTSENLQSDLRQLVEGEQVGSVIKEGVPIPMTIKGNEAIRMSPEAFAATSLPLATGGSVPLNQVAQLITENGRVKIERENASRMSVVRANVKGRDLVGYVEEAKQKVAQEVKLPEGYRITWGGQFENQQRASARLMLVIPAALAMIFFLLFVTLGTVRQALLVFANIPFALIGGIVALGLTNTYLSVPASVGFIALMGIAVLNGLVLISYFNQLVAKGYNIRDVVEVGAMRRLRPVMMTASITAIGLIPLLLATGPGSEIQKPLATVVMGGLFSSTILTLILLPNLFYKYGREITTK